MQGGALSLNKLAFRVLEELLSEPERYGVEVLRAGGGSTILDLGVRAPSGLEAGLKMVEICLGGLGRAGLAWLELRGHLLPAVSVWTDRPALATLGAQMASWRLELAGEVVLGSGPARALARKPKKVFRALGHEEKADLAILALEASRLPDEELLSRVADACGVKPDALYVLVAPLASPAGLVQVVGRAVEACLLKLFSAGLDVLAVRTAVGTALLPPPHSDADICMGRANDALLYGSVVHLWADWPDEVAREAAREAPSCASPAYGKPFLAIYEEAGRDFYKIDPGVFAPARVAITSTRSGRTYTAGRLEAELLLSSFGLEAAS